MSNDYEFSIAYYNIDGYAIQVYDDGDIIFDCQENAEFLIPVATLQKVVFRTHRYMKERQDYMNGVIK